MSLIYRIILPGALIMFLCAPVAMSQDETAGLTADSDEQVRGKFSFGAGLGVFQPMGSWADHRYAPGVKQFVRGFFAEGLIEYEMATWGGFAVTFGGGGLGTGEWVDYTRSKGDDITASAHMYLLGILFRPYLVNRPRQILKLDIGGGSLSPSGNESFQHFAYNYDFLKSSFVFITGIEYCRFFKPRLALAIRAGLLYASGGVEYSDGLSQSIFGLPLTVGIRFYP